MPELISEKEIEKELKEFKQFAFKQSIVEATIAFMLAAAFTKLINAISEFLLMPLINGIVAKTGTGWREITIQIGSIVVEFGKFLGSGLDFLITALILYIIYKKILGHIVTQPSKRKKLTPDADDNN